jgi:hypothetical protein
LSSRSKSSSLNWVSTLFSSRQFNSFLQVVDRHQYPVQGPVRGVVFAQPYLVLGLGDLEPFFKRFHFSSPIYQDRAHARPTG